MSQRALRSPTRVRRLTPAVSSAIAAIAIDGPLALDAVSQALYTRQGNPLKLADHQVRFALWRFTAAGLSDEHVIVLVRGAEHVEIYCHGGLAVTDEIMLQLRISIRQQDELWTNRSAEPSAREGSSLQTASKYEHDAAVEDPLSTAAINREAAAALCQASTLKTALILLDQFQGALTQALVTLKELEEAGQTREALELCNRLLAAAEFGVRLNDPWRITLAGPPNVGKSSLMNALCGAARVLVHHEPGTTRDAIETNLVIGGWPNVLIDTAGIRESNEPVERQGIQTARSRWLDCDIGLLVVDALVGWTEAHDGLLVGPRQVIVIINKSDAIGDQQALTTIIQRVQAKWQASGKSQLSIATTSATKPGGIDELLRIISDYLDQQAPLPETAVPFTSYQVAALKSLQQRLFHRSANHQRP